jgi:hypothetical protein
MSSLSAELICADAWSCLIRKEKHQNKPNRFLGGVEGLLK